MYVNTELEFRKSTVEVQVRGKPDLIAGVH